MKPMTSSRHLSRLGAWAFAFGTAVGWGSLVMPGTMFLPKAGPLGTTIGVFVGAAIMAVIAWNYHYMTRRYPGPGGAFAFASRTFGADHGFLCAWFISLTYMAIVWANATALTIVARCLFGDALRFGFRYAIAGYDVYLGDILLPGAAILVAAAINCRRRLAGRVETVLAVLFAVGITVCFGAAVFHCGGDLRAAAPAFAQDGTAPVSQVLKIVALAPWFYVGFEAISNLSGEFGFSLRKTFQVMVAAVVTSAFVYAFLVVLPALAPGDAGGWPASVAHLGGQVGAPSLPTFAAASRVLGRVGTAVIGVTALAAIFTNLVGNITVSSRLLGAMADDGILPARLGAKGADGTPTAAVLFVAGVSLLIPFLGRTAIGFIVDVATIGTAIAYAYTSAAVYRTARATGSRLGKTMGICGLLLSGGICVLFILPNYFSGSMMATESYLILVLWCILGFLFYRFVFGRDQDQRFGHSTVVWITLLVLIFVMSHMWMRQASVDTTKRSFTELSDFHKRNCLAGADTDSDNGWGGNMTRQLESVNASLVHVGFVQAGLMAVSLAIMFSLYAMLRRRERRLEHEKSMSKSYFFSTVSHDIRTPLNAIVGFSEMLKAGFETEAEREQALDSILVSGRTLLGLINDVLDLSKLESGKMQIALEPTDCPRLLHGVMDAFRISGKKPGLDLRCEIGEMPALMLDPQRLRQIVFNLVGNAVKFTEKGHVALRAGYERPADAETGVFRLSVEDTGCGIAEEDQKRICSAYVQVGAKLARNGGTGLGLAICTQLVKAMGGELKVKSELGKGSTFEIEIPDVRSTVLPEAPASAAPGEALPGASAAPPRPVHRILLVDDSKMNLMVLKALLKKSGDYETTMAMDGQEALKALEASDARPYDLVLTDMWMPNLDGEGLVKSIRADASLASLRVLVVTADVEIRDNANNMGFDGILLKPVTPVALEQALAGNRGGGA